MTGSQTSRTYSCVPAVKWNGSTCMEQSAVVCPTAAVPPAVPTCVVSAGACQNVLGQIEIGGLTGTNAICNGVEVGKAGICGDGVVNGTEQCEPGGPNDVRSCSANTSAVPPVSYTGLQENVCDTNCHWYGWGTCRIGRCGDGVKQPPEICDDGDTLNGTYGHCAKGCGQTGFSCGDDAVQPNEACDDGVRNGQYGKCAWDCSGRGPRCGDGVKNGPEQCDGAAEEFKGLCSNDATKGCNADGDCLGGSCGNFCPTPEQKQRRVCNSICGGWSGWACTAPGKCGNNKTETGEQCDDGNFDNTDACIIDPTHNSTPLPPPIPSPVSPGASGTF